MLTTAESQTNEKTPFELSACFVRGTLHPIRNHCSIICTLGTDNGKMVLEIADENGKTDAIDYINHKCGYLYTIDRTQFNRNNTRTKRAAGNDCRRLDFCLCFFG